MFRYFSFSACVEKFISGSVHQLVFSLTGWGKNKQLFHDLDNPEHWLMIGPEFSIIVYKIMTGFMGELCNLNLY